MNVTETPLPGLLLLEPMVFGDERGFFSESWNATTFREAIGRDVSFVQDNHSRSAHGVLRGLHYQLPHPQAKLVRCPTGRVWDVAVDIRRSSGTFGQWFGVELSAENHLQLWVPEGFAHGFVVLSESADLMYKTTEFYHPESDRALRWDDPTIGIEWPIDDVPVISDKDRSAPFLREAELFE